MDHTGGRHGDVEPSGDDLPSGRVPGRAPEPSRSRVNDDDGDGNFRGILFGYLGFSIEELYMGEGLTRGRPVGPTPPPRAPGGGAAPPGGVGASWLPSISPSVSVHVTAIYGRGFLSRAIPRIFPV